MVRVSPDIPQVIITAPPEDELSSSAVEEDSTTKKVDAGERRHEKHGRRHHSSRSRSRSRSGSTVVAQNRKQKAVEAEEDADEGGSEEEVEAERVPSYVFPHEYYHQEHRKRWFHDKDCLRIVVACSVGVANVADFPTRVLMHGGPAFLIPYTLMVITYTLPVLYLESVLGQYVQSGVLGVWKLCPIFKGLGITMIIASAGVPLFFVVETSWYMSFLVETFQLLPVQWNNCQGEWNTEACIKMEDLLRRQMEKNETVLNKTVVLASKEFYRHRILHEVLREDRTSKHDLTNLGHNDRWLSLYITFVYIFLLFLLGFSHRVGAKAVWASILVPATLLSVLIFRGMSLPGSFTGIDFICRPDFGALRNLETWETASLQALTSAGAGYGLHLTIASYNEFNQDGLLKNAMLIVLIDFLLCVLATLLVFSFVGELSYRLQTDVKNITEIVGEDSVVFELLPGVIGVGSVNVPHFYLFFLYLMMLSFAIPKISASYECFLTGVMDEYPTFFEQHRYGRLVLTFIGIIVPALVSLSCASPGGIFIYLVIKRSFGGLIIIVSGLIFVLVITGVVGTQAIRNAVQAMGGHVGVILYFELCWCLLIGFHIYMAFNDVAATFDRSYKADWYKTELPVEAFNFSVCCIYISFVPIPIYAVFWFKKCKAPTFRLKWLLGISPEHEHKRILETGVAVRGKCIQCWCVAYCNKAKLSSRTDLQEPSNSKAGAKTTEEKRDFKADEKPEPEQQSDREVDESPVETKPRTKSDNEAANKFIRTAKKWKDLSLDPGPAAAADKTQH